jgi:ribosome biogenesis protein UTP30
MVKKVKQTSFISLSKIWLKKGIQTVQELIKKKQDSEDLLSDDNQFININIEVNKLPELESLRVVSIPIPFPLYSKTFNSRVFLIVKDPQRQMKEKLDEAGVSHLPISKVCAVSKLSKKYNQYKDRRELLRQYDLFVADVRVVNMLPERLGKYFFEKKRIPALVNLDENIKDSLEQIIGSTFLISAKGPVFTIKVGRNSMTSSEISENIEAVVKAIPKILPGISKENIRRIEVKGELTPALPVYNFLTAHEKSCYKSS